MEILINNEHCVCDDNITLSDLANKFSFEKPGIAIAVNMKVVSKDKWSEYVLTQDDKVIVINATCGG